MLEKPTRQRLDLVFKRVVTGDDPNQLHVEMEFDPRRYEWREQDGERCLYDKLEMALIPERVLHEMARRMDGLPIYYQPPPIHSSADYVASRRNAIAGCLEGSVVEEEFPSAYSGPS